MRLLLLLSALLVSSCRDGGKGSLPAKPLKSDHAILLYPKSQDGGPILKVESLVIGGPIAGGPRTVDLQPTGPDGSRFVGGSSGMEWTSVENVKENPGLTTRFPELLPKIESLSAECQSASLVLYHLPAGTYDMEAFLSDHCYPLVATSVKIHADLTECPITIPPVAYVRLRLAEAADRELTKAIDHKVICVFRMHDSRKSCLWSSSFSHIDEGLTEICVPIPTELEGWLVLQKPDPILNRPGMGVPLLDIKIPSDYKHDDEIPIRTKTPGDWSKRLPEWVVTGRHLKPDS